MRYNNKIFSSAYMGSWCTKNVTLEFDLNDQSIFNLVEEKSVHNKQILKQKGAV